MPFRPPTFPPRLWLPVTPRSFSTTSTRSVGSRGGSSTSLPEFNWRKPYKDIPRPSVHLISNEQAANTYLESLTSKRLTIDGDLGYSVRPGIGMTRSTRYAEGVITVADGEGVMILHLAQMKHAPAMLSKIFADPTIEKQKFGAPSFIRKLLDKDAEFFSYCQPQNFIDLRDLAKSIHPRLEQMDRHLVHNQFIVEYARDGMGMRLPIVTATKAEYSVQRIASDVLEDLVNTAWITHCAGVLLRQRLEVKISQALERDIPAIMAEHRHMSEPRVEEKKELTEMFVGKTMDNCRFGSEDVKKMIRMRQLMDIE